MTTYAEQIFAASQAHVPLTDLVDDRVFPVGSAEKQERPYITFQAITTRYNNILNTAAAGRRNTSVQVNCIGDNYDSAVAVAEAMKDAMAAISSLCVGEREDLEFATELNRVALDFSLW